MAGTGSVMVAAPEAALSAGELAGFIGAFNDAAARLQATHAALHAEVKTLRAELSEANEQVERSRRLAALGEMAAGIAHEVRNPLGSIGLYARMLAQDLGDRPEQREVARKIGQAVSRLNGVVGDVLAFARGIKVRPVRVDAGDLLREALGAARGSGPEWSGVEVRAPMGAGPEISGDPSLLQQALVNVIRNAVESMAELPAGTARVLTLEARPRTVRRKAGSAAMVSLVVRDSGRGIPAEVMERMFNPFFTTRATGTGLGLAIVHRIVDAHGGQTVVRNARGGGAVVELVVPGGEEEQAEVRTGITCAVEA